jgi:hypothetical protein
VGGDDLEPEFLTRSDIARILKVSTKQAGRLMHRMPTVRVGRTHRRVLRADFDAWTLRERETPERLKPCDAAARRAAHHFGDRGGAASGSVFRAAEAMKKRRSRATQHAQSYHSNPHSDVP